MAIEKEIKGKETAPAGEQTLVTYQTAENSEYGEIVLSNASSNALLKAQNSFSGLAEKLGVKSEDDVQALVDSVRHAGKSEK